MIEDSGTTGMLSGVLGEHRSGLGPSSEMGIGNVSQVEGKGQLDGRHWPGQVSCGEGPKADKDLERDLV